MKLGAQLYTLRDFCKNTEDFSETLKKVADMGYRSVQVSGTCAYDPDWLAEQLKSNGLTCDLTHIPLDRLTTDPAKTADDHLSFGCRYIGLGWYNGLKNESDVDALAEIAKKIAPTLREKGCLFLYHNHFTELIRNDRGVTRLIGLLNKTAPDELGFTLDTYWLQYGGADLTDYFTIFKGRIPCVHFKDYAIVGEEVRMAAVGDGNINFEKLIALCEDAGTEYIFVEQDNCYGESPFDCLKRSHDRLRALGIAD